MNILLERVARAACEADSGEKGDWKAYLPLVKVITQSLREPPAEMINLDNRWEPRDVLFPTKIWNNMLDHILK